MSALSVVVPAYNEARTIERLLDRVVAARLPEGIDKDVIVVDDCSTDDTFMVVQAYGRARPGLNLQLLRHGVNQGKGTALHSGIRAASGDYLVVQDADLEYEPREYALLLGPILDGFADVVYGSRFMGGRPHRILFFWHTIGNKLLTLLSNMFTNLNLTDMETCYKMFRTEVIQALPLREKRFGFEPEVTARIARLPNVAIYEVGISYFGRTYAEGKHIGWKVGVRAVYCILKYNLFVG